MDPYQCNWFASFDSWKTIQWFSLVNAPEDEMQRFFVFLEEKTWTQINSIITHLGMQSDGVLSTSHAANNFIGTGLFMLVRRSNRVGFSVNIFDIFDGFFEMLIVLRFKHTNTYFQLQYQTVYLLL